LRTRTTICAVLAAATLVLAGCGDDDNAGDASGEAAFNDADVAFAQGMIPHHQQAIEMSQLAQDRASNSAVKQLAADIEAAQGPEIETMTGWLEEWGEDVPSTDDDMEGMDHGDMSDSEMPGMMSEQEMSDLEAATGVEFDQMFLTMMIDHHQGAVEMAATEQEEGAYPDAIALAEKIETDQKAEIEEMQGLLGS
jgi:uncharacterized protein (DUF305 family)